MTDKMEFKEKEIWKYKLNDDSCVTKIYESDFNILIVRAEGIVTDQMTGKSLDFLRNYSKKKRKKIRLLLDNTLLHKLSLEARRKTQEVFDPANPWDKVATAGDSFAIRCLGNLYAVLVKNKMKFHLFDNKIDALKWLAKD